MNVSYNPATNRQTGDCADANGNLNSVSNCANGNYYDVENRITRNSGTLAWAYSYAPGNKRVWRGVWSGSTQTVDEVTYWGATGQKLVTYQLSLYANQLVATATGTNQYFGGKLIKNATGYVTPDRLGSIGKYFPYGQERPSATTDGKEKFATYFRDSETGLDYADQRYHQPGMGRFMTPDPAASSADPKDPGSWNRYSYTGGDPVNRTDSSGLDWVFDFFTGTWHSTLDYTDLCYMNVGGCQQLYSNSVFAYDLGSANYLNFLQFSDPYDLRFGAPGFGPEVNKDNIWGNVFQSCNGQTLGYLTNAGIDPYKPGGPSYSANGGIKWDLTDAESLALEQQLRDSENFKSSNITGAMHAGDVGSPNTDYRAFSGAYGDRSLQIVIGPLINGKHTVYADTDAFNPLEDVVGWFGQAFTEVLPGVMGFNVGCGQ